MHLHAIVSTWIKLSNPLPISVKAYVHPRFIPKIVEDADVREVLDKAVKAICNASERWEDIQVSLPIAQARRVVRAAGAQAEAGTTGCARLSVHAMATAERSRLNVNLDRIPNIPIVHLTNVTPKLLETNKVELAYIRSIHLESLPEADTCIWLIQNCPNLEDLAVTFTGAVYSGQNHDILAPKLRTLDMTYRIIYFNDDRDMIQAFTLAVLWVVIAPALTKLCITELGDSILQALHVPRFLTRSKCELKQFIYEDRVNGNHLRVINRICGLAPSLEVLDVRTTADVLHFCEFVLMLGLPGFLPHLTNLTLLLEMHYWIFALPVNHAFKSMAKMREGGTLEEVTLMNSFVQESGPFSEPDEEFVEEMEEMGTQFYLEPTEHWFSIT